MKLVVFGATGTVGKELVKQALFNGQHVIAYGRNVFTEDLPKNDDLELVQGALFDEEQVYHAVKGCDAVLCALDGATSGTDKTRSLGMKNIVLQMEKAGVHRIVAVGGPGVLDTENHELVMEQDDFPVEYYAVSQEHLKALEFLRSSHLNWTLVCPSMVEEGDPTGIFEIAADHLPGAIESSVSSGDLALFMLKELEENKYDRQRVGISS